MKKSIKIGVAALFMFTISVTYLYFFHKDLYYIAYGYVVNDHFDKNEKVFIHQKFFNKDADLLYFYRLARPLTLDDSLNTYLSAEQKVTLKTLRWSGSQPSKYYIIPSQRAIKKDSMAKYHTTYIGNYSGQQIHYVKLPDGRDILSRFVTIEINSKICDKGAIRQNDLPPNYTLADSNYYMYPEMLTTKQPQN